MHALTPTVQNMQVHNAHTCSHSTHVCRSQQAHSSGRGILKLNKVAESHTDHVIYLFILLIVAPLHDVNMMWTSNGMSWYIFTYMLVIFWLRLAAVCLLFTLLILCIHVLPFSFIWLITSFTKNTILAHQAKRAKIDLIYIPEVCCLLGYGKFKRKILWLKLICLFGD